MSYADQFEYQLTDRASVTSTGVKAGLAAAVNPFVVRRFGFLVTTAPTVQSLIITLEKSTAGAAAASLGITLTIPTTATAGKVYWAEGVNATIRPGDFFDANVTQAPTAGAGSMIIVLDPSYDSLGNEAQLVKVTS